MSRAYLRNSRVRGARVHARRASMEKKTDAHEATGGSRRIRAMGGGTAAQQARSLVPAGQNGREAARRLRGESCGRQAVRSTRSEGEAAMQQGQMRLLPAGRRSAIPRGFASKSGAGPGNGCRCSSLPQRKSGDRNLEERPDRRLMPYCRDLGLRPGSPMLAVYGGKPLGNRQPAGRRWQVRVYKSYRSPPRRSSPPTRGRHSE
jgi:hypothetical protein